MSIMVCYAPTNYSPDTKKDEFYEELQSVIDEIPEINMKIVIDDFNTQHKDIHKYTGISPCGNHKNQIDHIAINKEIWRILRNIRSYRRADIGSNNQLLIATLKFKLKAPKRNVDRKLRFDTTKLLEYEQRETFTIECRNEFGVSETSSNKAQTINEKGCNIKIIYQSVGSEVLGHAATRRKP
ncbi:craniofacial development protein 2-like [Palaemon carinicauda]|uniref:craniofacial development protein 2-like n=1 Tax=Palaemon carinicauda TaxID=392227 RepID=UPI0035B59776